MIAYLILIVTTILVGLAAVLLYRRKETPDPKVFLAPGQVLKTAGIADWRRVEELRRNVVGIKDDQTKTPERAAPAPAGQLPYWWQVCEPQDGFKNPATIDESRRWLLSAASGRRGARVRGFVRGSCYYGGGRGGRTTPPPGFRRADPRPARYADR